MRTLKFLYFKWIKLSYINFILITTLLSYILLIPLILLLILLDIEKDEIGGIDVESYSPVLLFITVSIIAPMVETLFSQSLPIKLMQKIVNAKYKLLTILFSALLFSVMHFGYSFWYSLISLPLGILLAHTYIVFQKRKGSSFWITSAVHSLRNSVPVVMILFEKWYL